MNFLVVIPCILVFVQCELNVHDRIYSKLDAVYPCVKRLNATQSIGCSSSRNGNVGVIHLAYNQTALNWVLTSPPHDSYIVVLPLNLLTNENLKKLNSSSKVNGVLVVQGLPRDKVDNYSPDYTCPNRYSGIKDECSEPWNPWGSGILWERWDMPIYFTDDEYTVITIEECFTKFNLPLDDSQLKRSLCALELVAQMMASGNSLTCIRRSQISYNVNPVSYCDVLGDVNIYVPIIPHQVHNASDPYILVTARLDAGSMFFGRTPGSMSTVTSLVTLILTAKLLYQLTINEDLSKNRTNVIFMLFNGEVFDYTGSVKMVFDMQNGLFPYQDKPLKLENVKFLMELSQLMPGTTYFHSRQRTEFDIMNSFKEKAKSFAYDLPYKVSERYDVPSSLQSFLVFNPNFPGFILSSYDKEFNNTFYNSLYDDYYNIKYNPGKNNSVTKYIAEMATVLAHSLYREITGKYHSSNATINSSEVEKLLECYVIDIKCKFAEEIGIDMSNVKESKPDLYVSIRSVKNDWTVFTKYALMYFMSIKREISIEKCVELMQNGFKTIGWIGNKGVCLESYVNTTSSVSPAFVISDYDFSSNKYPTWTESFWQVMSVRMFMQPSNRYQWMVFILGMIILYISFLVTYMINKYAKKLFKYPNLITASSI